ncbi:MAG: phosphopantetheine-binding protein, partial [Microvirgula sp.]
LFEPAQLRAMFQQYGALLRRLAVDDDAWQQALDTLLPRAIPLLPAGPAPAAITDRLPATPLPGDEALAAQLCAHFRQVVGQPISPRQNFFDAGASSLKLVQLHVRLQQAGHGNLQVTDLFAHPSPLALAARLGGLPPPPAAGAEPHRQQRLQRRARRQRRQEDAQ